jgi:phage FluMu protein Com
MKVNIVGEWESVDLCSKCGEVLYKATDHFWGKPCPNCASVGTYCPPHIGTSRRFITTYKPNWFQRLFGKKELGYWEYSGKSESGGEVSTAIMRGRVIVNPATTIVASGIASGLF